MFAAWQASAATTITNSTSDRADAYTHSKASTSDLACPAAPTLVSRNAHPVAPIRPRDVAQAAPRTIRSPPRTAAPTNTAAPLNTAAVPTSASDVNLDPNNALYVEAISICGKHDVQLIKRSTPSRICHGNQAKELAAKWVGRDRTPASKAGKFDASGKGAQASKYGDIDVRYKSTFNAQTQMRKWHVSVLGFGTDNRGKKAVTQPITFDTEEEAVRGKAIFWTHIKSHWSTNDYRDIEAMVKRDVLVLELVEQEMSGQKVRFQNPLTQDYMHKRRCTLFIAGVCLVRHYCGLCKESLACSQVTAQSRCFKCSVKTWSNGWNSWTIRDTLKYIRRKDGCLDLELTHDNVLRGFRSSVLPTSQPKSSSQLS